MEKKASCESQVDQIAKVLIIDDNPHNLQMISDFLEGSQFSVLVAEDGESGFQRAQYVLPDLILLDVLMPVMDGFETCRRLKKHPRTREIPVIFMTALAEAEHKVKAFQTGAVDYITKPFHKEEVLARLMVHFKLRELTAELQEANDMLEDRVAQRTEQLARTNEAFEQKIIDLEKAEETLRQNERMFKRNISELKQTSQALAASKNHLDKIINTVADPIFVKDRQHRWVLLNDACCSHIGQPRDKLLGKSDYDFFPENKADEFWAKDEIVFNSGEDNFNEEKLTDINGNIRTIVTQKRRYIDEDGNRFIVGIIRDITEHKNIKAQLRQAVQIEAIGTLAGGVAQDLNNLMTVVIGYSRLLQHQLETDSPLRRDIEKIRKAGENAAVLAHQLLAFSRKQVVHPQIVDLNIPQAEVEIERVDSNNSLTLVRGGSEIVLLVEDDDMVRLLAKEILEPYGYKILDFAKSHNVLRMLTQYEGAIDLLIMDVVKPEKGGHRLAEAIMSQFPEAEVLFISGYADDIIAEQGGPDAGLKLLHKPFSPLALAQKVRWILDNKKGSRPEQQHHK